MAAVSPESLAEAVTIRTRIFPHDLTGGEPEEEQDEDALGWELDRELEALAGSAEGGAALYFRSSKLVKFLAGPTGRPHYQAQADGSIDVENQLLEYAADAEMTDDPFERLAWPLS